MLWEVVFEYAGGVVRYFLDFVLGGCKGLSLQNRLGFEGCEGDDEFCEYCGWGWG